MIGRIKTGIACSRHFLDLCKLVMQFLLALACIITRGTCSSSKLSFSNCFCATFFLSQHLTLRFDACPDRRQLVLSGNQHGCLLLLNLLPHPAELGFLLSLQRPLMGCLL